MNGKPGDDPATDIVHHGRPVYSPQVDSMVRDLAKLMEFRRLQHFLDSLAGLSQPDVAMKVGEQLIALRKDGHERGWEIE
jgi:hypothetical protein